MTTKSIFGTDRPVLTFGQVRLWRLQLELLSERYDWTYRKQSNPWRSTIQYGPFRIGWLSSYAMARMFSGLQ